MRLESLDRQIKKVKKQGEAAQLLSLGPSRDAEMPPLSLCMVIPKIPLARQK